MDGGVLQDFDRVGYLDVHFGASFRDVIIAPGHVLAGGLLTLLVFIMHRANIQRLREGTEPKFGRKDA